MATLMSSLGVLAIWSVWLLSAVSAQTRSRIYVEDLPREHYRELGDLNMGVLIPVHHYNLTGLCSRDIRGLGLLQRMEAIAFTVREINQRSDLLPNHTIGFVMFDNCYNDITALAHSLCFIEAKESKLGEMFLDADPTMDGPSLMRGMIPRGNYSLPMYNVVGVLGSEGSISTTQMANLFSSLQLPQISYLSTSSQLANRYRYGHFLRTVSSNVEQAMVMVNLLDHFNWTYVSIIYASGDYGGDAYKQFLTLRSRNLGKGTVCFAGEYEITRDFKLGDYNNVVYSILLENKAKAVVVFTPIREALQVLAAAKRMQVGGRLTWIASDAWARNINDLEGYEDVMYGALSINFLTQHVPRFQEYFSEISPLSSPVNPWMGEFWQRYFDCTTKQSPQDGYGVCDSNARFTNHPKFYPDPLVSMVIDAVYTFAYGLQNALDSDHCSGYTTKDSQIACADLYLQEFLHDVKFEGETGYVAFNEKGQVDHSFLISNIQLHDGIYDMVPVAYWNQSRGALDWTGTEIQWSQGAQPESVCSKPCGRGEGQILQQKECCWVCDPCGDNQYTQDWYNVQRCYTCPAGTWPEQDSRTSCNEIIPTHLQWYDDLGILLLLLSSFGLAACAATSVLFFLNHSNPLIKASSRELSCMLLGGLVTTYVYLLTYIAEPSASVCFSRQLGWGLCLTLMYAPMVTKTIRILRIFKAGNKMNRNPSCVGSKQQFGIAFNIILVHNLVLLAWTLNDMPYALEIHPEPGKAETVCSFHVTPFIMSTAINGALLLSCAVCAFLTRKLPDNYNESKFIAFCVYCTVVIQLAFIPAFFTVGNSVYETMFLTVSLWLSATLILFCIFVPKLYAVYFVKEDKLHIRNIFVRKNGVHRKSDVSYASDFPLPCSNRPRFSLSEVPLMSKMCRSVSQDTANGIDVNDEIDKNTNTKESPNEVSNISVKPDEAAHSRQTSVGTLTKVPLEMVDEGSHPCAVSPGKSCAETIMGDTISVAQSAGSFSMFELDEKQ